jgi:hypothetical protein
VAECGSAVTRWRWRVVVVEHCGGAGGAAVGVPPYRWVGVEDVVGGTKLGVGWGVVVVAAAAIADDKRRLRWGSD